jgi:hypothetical protein
MQNYHILLTREIRTVQSVIKITVTPRSLVEIYRLIAASHWPHFWNVTPCSLVEIYQLFAASHWSHFGDVTPCSLVEIYRLFAASHWPHFRGRLCYAMTMTVCFSEKKKTDLTTLHGATSRKTAFLRGLSHGPLKFHACCKHNRITGFLARRYSQFFHFYDDHSQHSGLGKLPVALPHTILPATKPVYRLSGSLYFAETP